MTYNWSEHLRLYTWEESKRAKTSGKILLLGAGHNNDDIPRKIFLLGKCHYSKEWSNYITHDAAEYACEQQHKQKKRILSGITWTSHGNKSELEEIYNSIILASVSEHYKALQQKEHIVTQANFFTEAINMSPSDEIFSFGYSFLYYLQALTDNNWKLHSKSKNHDVNVSTLKTRDIQIPVYILHHT